MTVRFVPSHVRSAREIVATERQRTGTERDAFAQFADRIAAFDVAAVDSATELDQPVATQPAFQSDSQAATQLVDARDAYRETVMSVPHYAEEYDESLQEHVAAELSPEVATALTTGDQFTAPLQERLVAESREACTSRDIFLNALEDEADALQAADEQLSGLGSECEDLLVARSLEGWSSEELLDARQQLQADERKCEEVAADRQATVHEQRIPSVRHIDLGFTVYLYHSLSVTYPVLADVASLTETLRTAHSQVDCALDLE